MEKDIVLEGSKVTKDILIVQDLATAVSENKEFTLDYEVKDINIEE